MAVPTNTFQTVSAKGLREDLSDLISRIDPTECPFTANVGTGKAAAQRHEWQTQTLAAANPANAIIEGSDAVAKSVTPTVRVSNIVQTAEKTVQVSGMMQQVDKAGRDDELAYQLLMAGLELRRDIEARLVGNYASVMGDGSSTANTAAGIQAWLTTNVSRGSTGANGGFNSGTGLVAAATNGTQRTFTEALLKTVHQSAYTNGGKPSILMVGPAQKAAFSGFAGIAVNRVDNSGKDQVSIVGGADVYVGDFGKLTAVVNIFQDARSALLLDPKLAKVAYMRKFKQSPLAKTGDSEKRQVITDFTLQVENEKGHGIVADLT